MLYTKLYMMDKSLIFSLGAACAHAMLQMPRRRVCMKDSEHKACVLNGKEFLLCVTAAATPKAARNNRLHAWRKM
jgi:hypothetical protein